MLCKSPQVPTLVGGIDDSALVCIKTPAQDTGPCTGEKGHVLVWGQALLLRVHRRNASLARGLAGA